MGDDPLLPQPLIHADAVSGQGGSAATGGSVTNIHTGLSKGGQLSVVIIACLALGIAIGCAVFIPQAVASERERARDQITATEKRAMDAVAAAEKRAMDAVYLAQQQAALAREDVRVMAAELNRRGISIPTSH